MIYQYIFTNCSNQGFDFEEFKKKKPCQSTHDREDLFSAKFNNLKILLPNISICYGKKYLY